MSTIEKGTKQQIPHNVKWDATDSFPKELAYFMHYVIGNDQHQAQIFEDWLHDEELREHIYARIENGYLVEFIPDEMYYTLKGISKPVYRKSSLSFGR